MEYLIICTVALVVSALTLFSGFGLGTLLMPAFALFFSVPVAVAATALVHLANNLFKLGLVGRQAHWGVVARFALPASLAALLGASLLTLAAGLDPVGSYELGGSVHQITPVKLSIGGLIVVFSILELTPAFAKLQMPPRYIPLGGLLSGFFGGLTGIQGELRSAFLIKAGLDKEAFIATNVVCAVAVDVTRLAVYGASLYAMHIAALEGEVKAPVFAAMAAAFAGAALGKRLMHKVTLRAVQVTVSLMLMAVGLGLVSGLV